MIIGCKCKSEGQDKLHGNGRRVANKTSKKVSDKQAEFRCTVCGSVTTHNV